MRVETHEVVKDGFLWKTIDVYPGTREETEFLRGFVAMAGANDASVVKLGNDGVSLGVTVMVPIQDMVSGKSSTKKGA